MSGPGDSPVLAQLGALFVPYLERQPWYWSTVGETTATGATGATAARGIEVETAEVLAGDGVEAGEGAPTLARVVVRAGSHRLQLMLGWREATAAASVLRGRDSAILGAAHHGPTSEVLVYDALADDELLLAILVAASGGAVSAKRARLVESLTSHSSVIYDDRYFMKLYRVLEPSTRLEVDMMLRLDEAGFNHLVAPVALWSSGGSDLALVREYMPDALEGRALALTSLRDLFGSAGDEQRDGAPTMAARAGGDLAAEMRRLGETTAKLHLALAKAFGESDLDTSVLAAAIAGAGDTAAAEQIGAMAAADTGRAIRVHGDYHLRRVMRSDVGWIVVGFGDDPSRPAGSAATQASPRGPRDREVLIGSPLEDVADMCFAIAAAADEAVRARHASAGERARRLSAAWVERNTEAFVDGYLAAPGVAALMPSHPAAVMLILSGLAAVRRQRGATSPVPGRPRS